MSAVRRVIGAQSAEAFLGDGTVWLVELDCGHLARRTDPPGRYMACPECPDPVKTERPNASGANRGFPPEGSGVGADLAVELLRGALADLSLALGVLAGMGGEGTVGERLAVNRAERGAQDATGQVGEALRALGAEVDEDEVEAPTTTEAARDA